jgi:type IV secretory pathway TraG/TraD family ATPase VirD4
VKNEIASPGAVLWHIGSPRQMMAWALTMLLYVAVLSSSVPAFAQMFVDCRPSPSAWDFYNDTAARDRARDTEELRCKAVNDAQAAWAPRLDKLNSAVRAMDDAATAQKWAALRAAFQGSKPTMLELRALADQNSQAMRAGDIQWQFGTGLADRFKNSGFMPTATLDDAFKQIDDGLMTPGKEMNAATVATNFVRTVAQLGREMAASLSEQSGVAAKVQANKTAEAAGARHQEQISGSSTSTYAGGFGARFKLFSAVLSWAVIAFAIAAFVGFKTKRPKMVLKAPAIALAVGVPLWLVKVFLPFISDWAFMAAALVGFWIVWTWTERLPAPWSTFFNTARAGGAAPASAVAGENAGLPAGLQGAGSDTHGSARWGTTAEIMAKEHIERPGLALARVSDAPTGIDQRFRYLGHVVTVAPNGSGKGIGQVIPNLLDYPGSCLVLDVKGENAAVTARARRELGQKVFIVDPFGVNGQGTAAFNVLDRLDVTNPDCVAESAALAECLVIPDKGDGANHFDETAKNLLQGLMLHVAGLANHEKRTLGEVHRLLTSDEESFLETMAEMASDDSAAFGLPARAANTLMGTADRERGSILSTARRSTAFLNDPRIAAALARSDFNLAYIKSELMTVYLVMPANRIGPNARFLRCFIGSVIAAITSSAKQPPHRVVFVLDEFAQLGYMKAIEDAVSLMRGYGLAFWVFLQDLSQLKGVYPRWQTFMANSAKVFFGTDDYDTAKYVSDSLGKGTIEYETHNEGRNTGSGVSGGGGSMNRGKSTGTSQQLAGRELLTPDEVMRMGPDRPLVLVKGEYPYLLARLNYLADAEYVGKADSNPYHS